ncbi:hypothetical protein D3C73_904220 [compost metagenome]
MVPFSVDWPVTGAPPLPGSGFIWQSMQVRRLAGSSAFAKLEFSHSSQVLTILAPLPGANSLWQDLHRAASW